MLTLRRRLASWALALLFCQAAAVFAAPMASCCARSRAALAQHEDEDCCPAGSHPPGQCPRHAAAANTRSCRLQCDAPHGVQLLVGALGVLPAPAVSVVALVPNHLVTADERSLTDVITVPHSPPPRNL